MNAQLDSKQFQFIKSILNFRVQVYPGTNCDVSNRISPPRDAGTKHHYWAKDTEDKLIWSLPA